MMNGDNTSILITSCDSYSDLWKPCLEMFRRNWPDCPLPVYLGTDFKEIKHLGVTCLPVGGGLPWAPSFRRHLEAVPTPNVIFFVADFFLRKKVDTSLFRKCHHLFLEFDAHCLRLSRPGRLTPIFETEIVGQIPVGSPYRLSCNPGIWKKKTLLELLKDDETIWQFEMAGSLRTNRYPGGFYGSWKEVLHFGQNVVERGKWLPWEAHAFGALDIGCDFATRPIMSNAEAARWVAARGLGLALERFPWQLHWYLRKKLGRRGHERATHGADA